MLDALRCLAAFAGYLFILARDPRHSNQKALVSYFGEEN